MSRACVLYVSNKVHAGYMRVEDALNAFGTRSRNDSIRYMRVPILREIAEACMRRAFGTFDGLESPMLHIWWNRPTGSGEKDF